MPTKKSLKIYNTLSGKKELFKPQKGKKVNVFVCGPTVYDFSHIGHARTYIIFDSFVKYLRFCGFDVFYLQNITDVDDKIIARAKEKGVSPKDLAQAFLQEHLKDMKSLGVTSVNKYAKATDYIKEIISQVERLIQKGYAYKLDDGIYFDIVKFKNYGKLSGRTALGAEDSVSRIDYSTYKKNRGDFCLWKFSAESGLVPGGSDDAEPSWASPFGSGRPGWHIEDTAITETFFGPQYDIHGGARDLMFPHHEAEIAQMEALSDKKPLAKYWMHTGFLTIGEQKMSKSLQNSLFIRDFLKRYSLPELRFLMVKNLWSSPINYSDFVMIETRNALEKIEEFLRKIKAVKNVKGNGQAKELLKKAKEDFYKNLDDDFNTPKAFGTLFDLIKKVNILLGEDTVGKKEATDIDAFFEQIDELFGIIDFKKIKETNFPAEVTDLVRQREEHRKSANWQKADETRLEIEKYGYTVQDSKDGPVLKKI